MVCFDVLCTFWLRHGLRATTACNFSTPAALACLLFDPPEPQIIKKAQCFATFLPFRASASSFFWLFLFYSSLLSDSSHLCFSSVHIVGSLTSKLPSIIFGYAMLCPIELCQKRSCSSEGDKGMLTRPLAPCLRHHSFGLREGFCWILHLRGAYAYRLLHPTTAPAYAQQFLQAECHGLGISVRHQMR